MNRGHKEGEQSYSVANAYLSTYNRWGVLLGSTAIART